MLGFLVDFFGGLVSLLTGTLPQSPFQNMSLGSAVGMAIGWLNWLVPVGDMAGVFALWLSALILAAVVAFCVKKATGVIGMVGGGK